MSFVRLNPRVFGLEGFLEKSLSYIEEYSKELKKIDIEKDPESFLIISSVMFGMCGRLSSMFGDEWCDEFYEDY